MSKRERGGRKAPETGQISAVPQLLQAVYSGLLSTPANVCVTEGGGRVSTKRGGRATEAGERETLPERRSRAHGEEKGVPFGNKHV